MVDRCLPGSGDKSRSGGDPLRVKDTVESQRGYIAWPRSHRRYLAEDKEQAS